MSNNHHKTPSNSNPPPNFSNPQMGVSGNYQNQNFMQQPFTPNMQQPPPPYMNAPNQLHMSHMGALGPQNNQNYNPMFPVHGQGQQLMHNAPPQMNLSQIQGQILAQNILNLLQQPNMNMNMNVPNCGQFSGQYPMQNMNQQLPMQMQMQRQNPSQAVPYGMHPSQQQQQQPMFGFPNQVPHPMVPQNQMFSGNSQFGVVPGNQVRPQIGPNPVAGNTNSFVSGPFPSQQLQGNSSVLHNTNNAQSSAFRNSHSKENPNSNINTNFANSTWKGSPNNNLKNKQNRGGSQGGFQKSKFRDNNKGNRRTKFPKERKGKGPNNERAGAFGLNLEEHQKQPTGSFSVTYSEQDVLQWREARRKNHPSREKNEKKPSEQSKDFKCIDREVLRRELKEVLAKQAELGVEVAEIPSYYLKNAANQGLESEEKETTFTDKRKFKNKGRRNSDKRGWKAKKQKLADKNFFVNNKKPTLLQKLLSADIKRDQSYLFQVFRFMTSNSFFKDYPDKPLVYPSILVKEMGSEAYDGKKHLHGEQKHLQGEKLEDGTKGIVQRLVKDSANEVKESDDDDDDDGDNGDGVVEFDEEEGEILE